MRQFSRGTHRHSIPTHPQGAIATHPRVAAKARQITISAVVRRVGLTDSGFISAHMADFPFEKMITGCYRLDDVHFPERMNNLQQIKPLILV